MKSKIIIVLLGISLTAAACTPKTSAPTNNPSTNQPSTTNATPPVNTNGQNQTSNTNSQTKPGQYKDYSTETVKAEQEAGNKVVLFFHAPWCPFCKAADLAFRAKVNQIPSGVTILKIDYDSSKDLRTKYGVTYQHTFVQIDNSGNLVTKWNGGDIANVIKYVK
jgi:thioredoxin 1